MKRSTILVATAAAALAFVAGLAVSQPAQPDMSAIKKQMAQMMAAKGQPGEAHKRLEPFVGACDVQIKFESGPGMPPITAKASSTGEWVLGGRFVQIHSTPAADEDLKIESISYLGYDTRTSKYFWWGVDSTDTYCVYAEGDYDDATKTFTLFGENLEPEMGGKVKFKTIFTLTDANTRTMAVKFQIPENMRSQVPATMLDADGYAGIMQLTSTRKP